MDATGELALLPMLSPVRVEMPNRNSVSDRRLRQLWQPRVRRLPPKAKFIRSSYGPGGYTLLKNHKGRTIDLYA